MALAQSDGYSRLLDLLTTESQSGDQAWADLRSRLCRFFSARRLEPAEDFADETLSRLANFAAREAQLKSVTASALGIARNVALEGWRSRNRPPVEILPVEPPEDREARIACYEKCLAELPSEKRDLLLRYYGGAKSSHDRTFRDGLAASMGVSPNALRIRVARICADAQACAKRCQKEPDGPHRDTSWK